MNREPLERFELRWKAWAERPPRTSPEAAARRVLSRLDEGERRDSQRISLPRATWLAAAAAVLLAVAVGLFAPSPPPAPPPRSAEVAAPPLDDGVVLLWLDSETPLYMSFEPPPAEEGDPS